MKNEGVFKSDLIFINLGDDSENKFVDQVDIKKFKEIKFWKFKKKINNLHDKGILPNSCYRLFDYAREIRNLQHEHPLVYPFSEKDLQLFEYTHRIASQLYNIMTSEQQEKINDKLRYLKKSVEKILSTCFLNSN